MKKFTLTLAACAVALSGMAQTAAKSMVPAEMRKADFTTFKAEHKLMDNIKASYAAKNTVLSADDVIVKRSSSKTFAPMAKEEGTIDAIATYMFGYYYSDLLGGTVYANMREAAFASYVNDGAEYILFDYTNILDPIPGIVVPGTNQLSAAGADSVMFMNNVEVGATTAGQKIYACLTNLYRDEAGVVVAERQTEPQMYGSYYFPENKELYVTATIGYYIGESTTPISGMTYGMIDMVGGLDEYMTKAQITGIDDDKTPFNNDGACLILGGSVYVKGLSLLSDDAWTEVYLGGEDAPAGIYEQFEDEYSYWDDAAHTSYTTYSIFQYPATVSFDEHKLLAWTDYVPVTLDMDLDDNYVINFGGTDGLVAYGSGAGWFGFIGETSITILNEPYYDTNGIKGVSSETAKVASKQYFDLSGRKVESSAKGLVIEKVTYSDGKTVSRKVVK